MNRIEGELAQLRTQCENRLNDINSSDRPNGRPDPHVQLTRVLHERLLRIEDALPPRRNPFTTEQAPATASEIDLWEAQPDAPPNLPIAIRALIARIRRYEADLTEARNWATLNRKRADDAVAGKKVEPLDAPEP
jgi:hypothetical protein